MTELETAWLAGLLEGEGSFGQVRNTNGCHLSLSMTDEDVVRKAAKLMDIYKVVAYERKKQKPHHKQQWYLHVCGDTAVSIMTCILPYMGQRRSQRIKFLLANAANRMTRAERCRMAKQARGLARRDTRTLSLEF